MKNAQIDIKKIIQDETESSKKLLRMAQNEIEKSTQIEIKKITQNERIVQNYTEWNQENWTGWDHDYCSEKDLEWERIALNKRERENYLGWDRVLKNWCIWIDLDK